MDGMGRIDWLAIFDLTDEQFRFVEDQARDRRALLETVRNEDFMQFMREVAGPTVIAWKDAFPGFEPVLLRVRGEQTTKLGLMWLPGDAVREMHEHASPVTDRFMVKVEVPL
jgi:hypothetical protein